LIRLAVLLFLLDVAVRRIQLDPDEVRRAMRRLRAWLLFWEGVPRAPQAEESLSALLARRDEVRSRKTAPALEPNPELFRPEKTPALPGSGPEPAPSAAPDARPEPPAQLHGAAVQEPAPASTATRLLEAKRRAQRRGRI